MFAIVAVVALAVLAVLAVLLRRPTVEPFEAVPSASSGKVIWLLWWQGWDRAPWVARRVRESWEKLNPDWRVELVSEKNLRDHISGRVLDIIFDPSKDIGMAAKSDLVRLALLAQNGGVWADSTALCMMPLDPWLYDVLEPTGFWMYHGRDHGTGPCSWFMVSIRDTYVYRTWLATAIAYWDARKRTDDYYWMDSLFVQLCEIDDRFRADWNRVPYIWCDEEGQSHMLQTMWSQTGDDEEAKRILRLNPPYVLKFSRHGLAEESACNGTNMAVAIAEALGQAHAPHPLHTAVFANDERPFAPSDTVLVGADCGHADAVQTISSICRAKGVKIMVYDKCNFCQHAPDVYCRPLRNTGRDMSTYLHFAAKYYHDLPENILFCATNNKHNRVQRIRDLIDNKDGTSCGGADSGDFSLDDYEGNPVHKARARPLKTWYDMFAGDWESDKPRACWNGVMRTTRARIQRHPRWRYINLYRRRERHGHPEEAHFMERVMDGVF